MDANLTKFFVQHFPQIYKDLKDKTNLIDAQYVKKYIDKYAEKISVTSGVEETFTSSTIDKLLPNKKQFDDLIDAIGTINPPSNKLMMNIQDIMTRLEAYQQASANSPIPTIPTGSTLPTSVDFTDLINAINDGNFDTQDILRELQQTLKDVNTNSLRKLLVAQGDKSIINNQAISTFLSTPNSKGKYKIDEPDLNKLITDLGYDLNDYPTIEEKYKLLKDNKQLLQTINKIIVNSPDEDIDMKLELVARQYNLNTIDDLILQVSNIEQAFNIYLNKIPSGDPVPQGEISLYLDKIIPSNGGNMTAIQTPVSIPQNNSPPSTSFSASTAPINSSPVSNIPNIGLMPLNLDFIPDIVDFANTFSSRTPQEQDYIVNSMFGGDKSIVDSLEIYSVLSQTPNDNDKIDLFVKSGIADPNATTQEDIEKDLTMFVSYINGFQGDIQSFNLSQNVAPTSNNVPVLNNPVPNNPVNQGPFSDKIPLDDIVANYLRTNATSFDEQYYLTIYDFAKKYDGNWNKFIQKYITEFGDNSKTEAENYDALVNALLPVNNNILAILMQQQTTGQTTGSGLRKARKTPKTTRKSSHPLLDYFKNNKYR
jgi:hypothetical protein